MTLSNREAGAVGGTAASRAERPVILLVSSDPDTADMYELGLHVDGFRPILAARLEDALLCARQEHPAVVVADIDGPAIDGSELLERLRTEASMERTPVVLVTADIDSVKHRNPWRAVVLLKPCLPARLAEVIRQFMGGHTSESWRSRPDRALGTQT